MAAKLNMSRNNTKTLQYTMQYGGGETRIKTVFGVSQMGARAIRSNYFDTYPGFKKMTATTQELAQQRGWVRMWNKRRRHFLYPESEAHKAFNAIIQGGGFEIVKRGMIKGWKDGLINDECRLDLQ